MNVTDNNHGSLKLQTLSHKRWRRGHEEPCPYIPMNPAQRYDKLAAHYDVRWRKYNRAVHDEVLRHLPRDLSQHRVLDVGCGTGEWLEVLLRSNPQIVHVVGVEPSRGMQNQACARFADFSSNAMVELLQSRIEDVSPKSDALKSDSFGLVTCLNVLHYLNDATAFFADAHRVLDVGGTLIVQDYTHINWPFYDHAVRLFDGETQHLYTPREMSVLAESAGFTVKVARCFRISQLWRGAILVARKN